MDEINFVPPYRVGRKQGRVILDSLGHEVGIFKATHEEEAQKYCDFLNKNEQVFDEFKKQFDESFSNVTPSDFVTKMLALGYAFVDLPKSDELTIDDYKQSAESHNKLVRELDVILNGEEGAAKQASLCDIINQIKTDIRFNR